MPDLDLGPAIEAGALELTANDHHNRGCEFRRHRLDPAVCTCHLLGTSRHRAQRVIEGALPELRKAIAEEQKQDHVTVVHALTHAVDKLATAKAALRGVLNTHTACMAPDKLDHYRAILADLDAEPDCVRGQSGGR